MKLDLTAMVRVDVQRKLASALYSESCTDTLWVTLLANHRSPS